MEKIVGYELYTCPENPSEYGKYYAKTPILEQAEKACELAQGKLFIKAVTEDGKRLVML